MSVSLSFGTVDAGAASAPTLAPAPVLAVDGRAGARTGTGARTGVGTGAGREKVSPESKGAAW